MTSVRLPRLSKPDVLQSIDRGRLLALLKPFGSFFESHGVALGDADELDCEAVLRVITQADRGAPVELLNAICIIDEMAGTRSTDLLLDELSAAELHLEPGGRHSAADIATAAWIHQRERLLRVHARAKLKRARMFDYYQSSLPQVPTWRMPTAALVRALENDCDAWFIDRHRGRGTRIEIFAGDHEVELSIRHGSLFRREQTPDDGSFGTVAYRPVQSDAAIYNRLLGELRVNAKSPKEKVLYCRLIGLHLFGDANCFPTGQKYSLEPLREYGAESLSPGDVNGIRSVKLVELRLNSGNQWDVITVRKGQDLFARADENQKELRQERRLLEATFKMQLFGQRDARSITIRPPNVAIYNRGLEAATIEAWLLRRGFVNENTPARGKRSGSILASA